MDFFFYVIIFKKQRGKALFPASRSWYLKPSLSCTISPSPSLSSLSCYCRFGSKSCSSISPTHPPSDTLTLREGWRHSRLGSEEHRGRNSGRRVWAKTPASLGWGGEWGWGGVCWDMALWGHWSVEWGWAGQDQRPGKDQAVWLMTTPPSHAFASELNTGPKAHIRTVFVGWGSVTTCKVGFPRWSIRRPESGFPTQGGYEILTSLRLCFSDSLQPRGCVKPQDGRNCISKGGKKSFPEN